MSRGGGGGARGGFAMRGGRQRIGGQEVTWDYDPDLEIDTRPQDLFPVRVQVSTASIPSTNRPTPNFPPSWQQNRIH